MPKITKRLVDELEPDPAGNEIYIADTELKGFGVRMMPTGVASYIIRYRNSEGRARRFVLGRVGVLTPDEGRKFAREHLVSVTKGADPSAERRKLRTTITVAELCDAYVKACESGERLGRGGRKIKASTIAMDRSRIETHVKPLLGRHSVAGLTSDDIAKFQADIAAGKTKKVRPEKGRGGVAAGGAGVAARTLGMLTTILGWAVNPKRIIKENPANGVKKIAGGRNERFLDYGEIGKLGAALCKAEETGEKSVAFDAIRLKVMTGLRRQEDLGLKLPWLDARSHCIRFTDTKSGPQMRVIGADAVKLIQSRPKNRQGWVFPSESGDGHFVGLPRVISRICKSAKLEGVTPHVLRHTFSSAAEALGYSQMTIAGLLGHSVPGVTAAYTHIPDAALVSAADRIASYIRAALDGKSEEEARKPT